MGEGPGPPRLHFIFTHINPTGKIKGVVGAVDLVCSGPVFIFKHIKPSGITSGEGNLHGMAWTSIFFTHKKPSGKYKESGGTYRAKLENKGEGWGLIILVYPGLFFMHIKPNGKEKERVDPEGLYSTS